MKPKIRIMGLIALLVVIVSGAAVAISVLGGTAAEANTEVIEFDVAENVSKFAFDEAPVHEDGLPTAIRSSPKATSTRKGRRTAVMESFLTAAPSSPRKSSESGYVAAGLSVTAPIPAVVPWW